MNVPFHQLPKLFFLSLKLTNNFNQNLIKITYLINKWLKFTNLISNWLKLVSIYSNLNEQLPSNDHTFLRGHICILRSLLGKPVKIGCQPCIYSKNAERHTSNTGEVESEVKLALQIFLSTLQHSP